MPFASVTLHLSLEAAAADWSRLLAAASVSPYQRPDWIAAWIDTEGRAAGMTPLIAVARDRDGLAVALLPLGFRRSRGLRVAAFLGGRETNYNMGLFDPARTWTPRDAGRFLRVIAASVPGGLDLFTLIHQPETWGGFVNPLAGLPRSQPSPSSSHRAVLQQDAEAFLRAHLSSAARKKIRSKHGQLALLGPVQHRIARTPAAVEAVLTAYLAQKAAKLRALGIAVPDLAGLRRLLDRACLPSAAGPAPVELHALHCGETVVATFAGLAHDRHFSGLLISYATEPAFARCSPGELLLGAVIAQKCAEGFAGFDLGVGEARYKDSYCPVDDPLVDSFLPLTLKGHAGMALDASLLRLKSAIKRSPRVFQAAKALRKSIGRLRRR